jgi:hypothetical protein
MENKNWIEKLLLFIPKSKYNVGILWNEELKCNIIDIYVPGPYIEVEYYLFYDNVKSIYNVGDHVCDWHSEGGVLYEDINNFDIACAAFIYYIWDKTPNDEKHMKDGEDFEEWRSRIKQMADNLFIEVSKYFDIKESDKRYIYKYGRVNGVNKYGTVNDTNKIPEKRNLKESLFDCNKLEIIQTAEK